MVRALTAFDVNLLIVFLRGKEANCESHIRLSVLFQPPIGHEAGKLPPLDLAVVIQIQALDHLLDLRAKRSGSMQVSHRKAWGSDGDGYGIMAGDGRERTQWRRRSTYPRVCHRGSQLLHD